VNEEIGLASIAVANPEGGNEFGRPINRHPRPNVAPADFLLLGRAIPFLGPDERPNLIALDILEGQIAEGFVLILRAGGAELLQKFQDGRAVNPRHAGRGSKGIPFHETGNDLDLFGATQLVHGSNMLERSSMRKRKDGKSSVSTERLHESLLPPRLGLRLRQINFNSASAGRQARKPRIFVTAQDRHAERAQSGAVLLPSCVGSSRCL